MDCSGDDEQFLVIGPGVILHHIGKGIPAEIAGVGFLPVDHQHSTADFIAVAQDGHIEKGQGRGGVQHGKRHAAENTPERTPCIYQ